MPLRAATWCIGVLSGLFLLLSACQSIPTKTYEVRQRAFTYNPAALVEDYREEYAYIEQRRHSVADGNTNLSAGATPPIIQVPPHLKGLAFSGGGICSATFHLGILEALQDMKTLPAIDYLSTVSGGSYIAGWMLAHLGNPQDDAYGNLVQTHDPGELLDPTGTL